MSFEASYLSYLRASLMRLMSLLDSAAELEEPVDILDASKIEDNIERRFRTFQLRILSLLLTRCSPVILTELLKVCFKQQSMNGCTPDRLFPVVYTGIANGETVDRLPRVQPFTSRCGMVWFLLIIICHHYNSNRRASF